MNDSEALRNIPGFENYEEPVASRAYIKILQGKAATAAKVVPGTIIRTDSKEVVCEVGKPLKFVPLTFAYRHVMLDEDKNITDTLRSGAEAWDSGRPVQPEDTQWINGEAPVAHKALDIAILPASELLKETKTPAILSIIVTNKQRAKVVYELMHTMKVATMENKLEGMQQGSYTLSVDTFSSGKNEWLDWTTPTYAKKISPANFALCTALYKDIKDGFAKAPALQASTIEEPKALAPAPVAEVADEAPKRRRRTKAQMAEEVKDTAVVDADFSEVPAAAPVKETTEVIEAEVAEDIDF